MSLLRTFKLSLPARELKRDASFMPLLWKMHPPPFSMDQKLSDWPDRHLEIRCSCGRSSHPATKLLIREIGDRPFKLFLSRLQCKECKHSAAPVYLVAGRSRTQCGGETPGWAVELIPPQQASRKLYDCEVTPIILRRQQSQRG